HRVLYDLDEDLVAFLESLLDTGWPLRVLLLVVGDVGGVEDTVLLGAEVEERCLHPGKDVAHLGEVDVADHRGAVRPGDVVLDEEGAFEDDDLGLPAGLADERLAPADVGRDDELVIDGATAVGPSPGRGRFGPALLRLFGLLLPLRLGGGRLLGRFLSSANLDGLPTDAEDLPLLDDIGRRLLEHRRGAATEEWH